MSVNSDEDFDFEVIAQRVGDFDVVEDTASENDVAPGNAPASEKDPAATTLEKENR